MSPRCRVVEGEYPDEHALVSVADGEPLRRVDRDELSSEGIADGAVEVSGDGRPLVFLADHPTTGGYPVIAVVDPEDLPLLGQAGPGDDARF